MTIQSSVWVAAAIAIAAVLAPAIALDEQKAAYACTMVVDPSTAINLQRPAALRYKAAPLRRCMPGDTDRLIAAN
jgi:hypothetical protein